MSAYSLIVDCINKTNIGDIVTRRDLVDAISYESSTLDVYRRKLTLLGFLSTDGGGNYKVLRKIPSFVTSSLIVKKTTTKIQIDRTIKLNKILNR